MIFKHLSLWSYSPVKEWVNFRLQPPSTCRCKGFSVPVLPARSSGSLTPSLASSSAVRVCLLQPRLWGGLGLLAFYLCTQSQHRRLLGFYLEPQFDFQDSREQKRKGWLEHVSPHGRRLASLLESLWLLTCPYMDLFTMACLEHSALRLCFWRTQESTSGFWKPESFPLLLSHSCFPLNKQLSENLIKWIPPTPQHTHTHTRTPISITDSLYLCLRRVCIWICPLCSDWASWGHAFVGKFHQGEVSTSAWGRGDQASLIKGFLSHGLRWVLLREGPSAKNTWLGVNRQGTYPTWPLTSHWASRKWERLLWEAWVPRH